MGVVQHEVPGADDLNRVRAVAAVDGEAGGEIRAERIHRDGIVADVRIDGQAGRRIGEGDAFEGCALRLDGDLPGGRVAQTDAVVGGCACEHTRCRVPVVGDGLEALVLDDLAVQLDGAGVGAAGRVAGRADAAALDHQAVEAARAAIQVSAEASVRLEDEGVLVVGAADQGAGARERLAIERALVGPGDAPDVVGVAREQSGRADDDRRRRGLQILSHENGRVALVLLLKARNGERRGQVRGQEQTLLQGFEQRLATERRVGTGLVGDRAAAGGEPG